MATTGSAPRVQPDRPGHPTEPVAVQIWACPELAPIGQFRIVGGVAVGYVTEGRQLRLVGLEPSSGRVLWQRPASLGAVVPGIALSTVTTTDGVVVYLQPDDTGPLYARLVAADPRTSETLASTQPLLFRSPPGPCTDGRGVCALSQPDYTGRPEPHRLSLDTGRYLPDDGSGLPPDSFVIAQVEDRDVLVHLGGSEVETVGLLSGGVLRWRVAVSEAFPPGFSHEHGWSWDVYPEEQVYTGSIFSAVTLFDDGSYTSDLAAGVASAALSLVDGSVLWRDRGSHLRCESSLDPAEQPGPPGTSPVPVRCRYSGTKTTLADGSHVFRGLDVVVEGFDVRTGATTWRVPLGAVESLAGADTRPAVAGQTRYLVQTPGGPVVLDTVDGATYEPPDQGGYWCRTSVTFTYAEAYPGDRPDPYRRYGGDVLDACDRLGMPSAAVPTVEATRAVGAVAGPHAVVATGDGAIGYDIG